MPAPGPGQRRLHPRNPTATRVAGTAHASAAPVSHQASASAAATTGTGAGGSAAPSPAGTALADKAVTNTENAASVRVTGHAVSTGSGSGSQAVSFDLVLVKKAGCEGTIALSKTETFRIVETGGYVWMLPAAAFYSRLHLSKAALALVADKYIRVKSSDKRIADLAQICTFNGLFGGSAKPTGTAYTATPGSYNGTPAYLLSQAGQAGTAIIANAATKITPPGDAETIDGSKLGV